MGQPFPYLVRRPLPPLRRPQPFHGPGRESFSYLPGGNAARYGIRRCIFGHRRPCSDIAQSPIRVPAVSRPGIHTSLPITMVSFAVPGGMYVYSIHHTLHFFLFCPDKKSRSFLRLFFQCPYANREGNFSGRPLRSGCPPLRVFASRKSGPHSGRSVSKEAPRRPIPLSANSACGWSWSGVRSRGRRSGSWEPRACIPTRAVCRGRG